MPDILRRHAIRLAAVIVAGFPATLFALTAADPLDAAGFVAALDRVAVAVAAADASGVRDLRAGLPDRWFVRDGSGQFDVPTDWIANPLAGAARDPSTWPRVRTELLARIGSVRAEAQSLVARPRTADGQLARDTLQDVLARREFANRRADTWAKRMRQRVAQWLLQLWQQMGGERLERRGTAIAFAWIAVIAAIGVLASWVVRGLLRASPGTRLGLLVTPPRHLSARGWALQAVSALDPREAARFAYHAAVWRMEEEGAWRVDDTRTPREYLRLLPPDHGRRTILADITSRFEQIWYGGRDATGDDVRHLIAGLRDLGCLPAE